MQKDSFITISKSALKHNLDVLKKIAGPITIAPCVKANAYGHGLSIIVPFLEELGVEWLCVHSVAEAEICRTVGYQGQLLIIGPVIPSHFSQIVASKSQFFLSNSITAHAFSDFISVHYPKYLGEYHLKIDTGMHRTGVNFDQADDLVRTLLPLPHLKLVGAATHFATAGDPKNSQLFDLQLGRFNEAIAKISQLVDVPYLHTAGSAALIAHPKARFNFARPGLSVYGYYPSEHVRSVINKQSLHLKPVLSWYSQIVSITDVPPGEHVGYGATWQCDQPSRVGIIPVGYSDGLDRRLSNRGYVLINGKRLPIKGRICMNMAILDLTEHDDIKVGDEVTIIGASDNTFVGADELAAVSGAYLYEFISGLNPVIPRAVVT